MCIRDRRRVHGRMSWQVLLYIRMSFSCLWVEGYDSLFSTTGMDSHPQDEIPSNLPSPNSLEVEAKSLGSVSHLQPSPWTFFFSIIDFFESRRKDFLPGHLEMPLWIHDQIALVLQSNFAKTDITTEIARRVRYEKVQRYLKKRKSRIWKQHIKYPNRKQSTDNRERVNGRFKKMRK
eukprot:TRINITY_DN4505_c0_g1_i4.p1 TRINITY_DN4505_c0_g1~~TRINITY_DN4505_c0_g1_i4.p1  ORF type:complete len:177 (-),score=4.33 TRINITY_DN4505_c0_g1_i4:214-744(-)